MSITAAMRTVRSVARSVARSHRLDAEELEGEAMLKLAAVLPRYDPAASSLVTFAHHCVRRHLTARLRSGKWRRRARVGPSVNGDEIVARPRFSLRRFKLEITADGAAVVDLVITLPNFAPTLAELCWLLSHRLGWDRGRVQAAVTEVADALRTVP